MIHGITDNVVPRLPRLGILRKGDEKGANRPGKDLPYFRFVTDYSEVFTAFVRAYTATPTMIRVFLPYATPEECFPHWMEAWTAGAFQRRCTGREMVCWRDQSGAVRFTPAPCKCNAPGFTPTASNPRCKQVGRLDVIIPELFEEGYVGYVTLETHSIHDIVNLWGGLKKVYEASGDLRGIELSLYRKEVEISTPGEGGRVRRTKSLVFISPSPEWARIQLEMQRRARYELAAPQIAGIASPALPAGDDDDDRDGAESVARDAEPTEPEPPASAPEPSDPEPEEFQDGALFYKRSAGSLLVRVGEKYLPAGARANISDDTYKRVESMFSNAFEMANHLKKHFGVRTLRSLTWEQFAALIAWKKDGVADPRWYADKAGQGMVDMAIELGGEVVDTSGGAPADEKLEEILSRYGVGDDVPGAEDMARALSELKDPYCLLALAGEPYNIDPKDNVQLYTDLAGAISSGSMDYGDETFWEVVKEVRPF